MELMMDVTGLQGMVRELYDPAYGQTFFITSIATLHICLKRSMRCRV
jgi:hypothetical protein